MKLILTESQLVPQTIWRSQKVLQLNENKKHDQIQTFNTSFYLLYFMYILSTH
jgi:hypothetical protein